jgi:hypothetical protein
MIGRRTAQVFLMLGGLIAWAMQFTVLYGATSTLCGRGWAGATLLGIGLVPFVILAATLVTLAFATTLLIVLLRDTPQAPDHAASATDGFLNRVGVMISGLSLVAILWNGIPALILPACA